jgi:Lysylphosphatidylglycerol synthase TM region
VRLALNLAIAGAGAVVAALTVRHFLVRGWPLVDANAGLIVAASALILGGYAFKAFGWRRVFSHESRPGAHALAAASGAASVTGMALPGRFDDVVRVAVVRRFATSPTGLGTICLSIVLVGFLDSAALTPLASVAAGVTHVPLGLRVGMALVAAAGIAAALIVIAMPRLTQVRPLARFRLVGWVSDHSTCTREASKALALVSVSWGLRAVALYVLLGALGVSGSFGLALLFLCASSASAALPISPGAATQAGAGAAALALAGVATSEAVAFAVSAQALSVLAGAAVVLCTGAWEARRRLRPAVAPA